MTTVYRAILGSVAVLFFIGVAPAKAAGPGTTETCGLAGGCTVTCGRGKDNTWSWTVPAGSAIRIEFINAKLFRIILNKVADPNPTPIAIYDRQCFTEGFSP